MDRLDTFMIGIMVAIVLLGGAMAADSYRRAHPREVPAIVCYLHMAKGDAHTVDAGQDPRCYIGR